MNRSRLSWILLALVLAMLVKIAFLWFAPAYNPEKQAALLDQARGYALGQRIAADLPKGGMVVFVEPEPIDKAGQTVSDNILKGLQAGCGKRHSLLRHVASVVRDRELPSFLQERVAGNLHLNAIPDAVAANPDAIAIVAKVDPAADLPPSLSSESLPPLYVLGSGESGHWERRMASDRIKAIQVDRPEGYTDADPPRQIETAAARYYRVIPALD